MERGNSDILVVLLWTLSFVFFRSHRFFLSGFLAGLSAVLKLYPAIACCVIGISILAHGLKPDTKDVFHRYHFLSGGVLACGTVCLLSYDQTWTYFKEVLPRFTRQIPPLTIYSHSLTSLAGGQKWFSSSVGLLLFSLWVLKSVRQLRIDPGLIFSGSLAISTYFADISNDYNLLTTYPLLLVLLERALSYRIQQDETYWRLLVLGLAGVILNRYLFVFSILPLVRFHVILQVLWLVLVTYSGHGTKNNEVIEGARRLVPFG